MEGPKGKFKERFHALQENPGAEDEDTIWLLSYADLMTLLFTFFVMLYSSAMMDEGAALRRALSAYIQGNGAGNGSGSGGQGAGDMKGHGNGDEDKPGSASASMGGAGSGVDIQNMQQSLKARLEQEKLLQGLRVEVAKNGLDITFSSNLLFELGQAELRTNSLGPLEKVIDIVKNQAPKMKVRVEGHTDDNPVSDGSRFKSNWELSGARAANIISIFEKAGFMPENLVAVGYGSSHPIAPNRKADGERDLDGQRRNRRVVVTIYKEDQRNPASTPDGK